MTRAARYLLAGLSAVGWMTALALPVRAETVELVTYYPTQANTGDLHVRSLTVGDEIRNDIPPNGVVLIFDELGIGLPPGTTDPLGPLHVVGVDGVVSSAVFMPGTGVGSGIRVGIGTANPGSALHVVTTTETTASFDLFSNVANEGPQPATRRARGTPAAPLAVQNGDDLGGIGFAGHDGANFRVGAVIDSSVDGAPAGGNVPSRIDVATNDGTSLQTRLSIRANGNVGIGTTAPRSTLHVAPAPGSGGRLVVDTSVAAGGEGGEVALATATPVTTNPTWHMDTIFAPNPEQFRIFRQPNLETTGTAAVVVVPVGPFTAQGNPAGYNVGIGTTAPGARLDVNGSVRIGTGGTPITRVISATATLNFPDTDGEDSSRLTVTVSGAAIGDVVYLGIPAAAALSNGIYTAWVSAANTVTVQFSNNNSGANLNPPSATFRIMVVKF